MTLQNRSQQERTRESSTGRSWRSLRRGGSALVVALLLATAAPVVADEYESDHTGHPLRVLAYVVHPIGVILDTLIFRPFHWLGSHEPVKTLFGHKN